MPAEDYLNSTVVTTEGRSTYPVLYPDIHLNSTVVTTEGHSRRTAQMS